MSDAYGVPPQAPPAEQRTGPRATFGQRLVAAIIDGVIVGVVNGILFGVLKGPGYGLAQLVNLGYAVYFEGSPSGQTLGKRATGIRVISSLDGAAIGFGRGLLRYLGKCLSGLALGIGYLWMLWDPERQTWQDKIANTYVVPVSAYPVSSWP